MRNIQTRIFAILMVVTVASFTVCKATGSNSVDVSGGGKDPGKAATWTMDASARAEEGTAELTLGFAPAVAGLGAGDFTFEGAAITADTLGGSGAARTLAVSNVPATGVVKVSVRKEGFDFNPASYDWDIATGNTEAAADDDATLASLSVTYTDKTGNLVGGFTPEETGYSFSVANGETAAKLSATAASSKASLVISYGNAGVAGQSVANGSNITLPTTGSKTLKITVTAESSDTQIYTVVIDAYIAPYVPPPTSVENDDYTLLALSVIYSGQADNILAGFDTANTNYSFNVAEGYETATVFAAVSSSHSSLDITYGEANADAPQDISIVNGGVITLPVAGSKVLKIKVTAQNNNTQTYYVTINAYVAVTKSYSGTIAYSGGSKSIIGVVGRDAAFVTQSAGVTGTAWTLTVPDGYTPESFVVTFSDGTYSYRSKALYPAVVSTSSSITLTIVDPVDIGRQVASAIDLADFANAPTVNYSLADDITLPNDWAGGPNNYSGRFYGNGYTISNLTFTSPISGSKGLFNSFGANAQVHDLNLEVPRGATPLEVNGTLYLGALIGSSTNPGLLVKNVHVSGGFNIGNVNAGVALFVGGIIGEVESGANFTMENCSADMDITMSTSSSTAIGRPGVGGLVGEINASITMTNCYSAGRIDLDLPTMTSGVSVYCGGLTGRNLNGAATIDVSNCYSSMDIKVVRGAANPFKLKMGGLFGYLTAATCSVTNVIAVNPGIIATSAGASLEVSRITGEVTSSGLSGAYAREDMALDFNGNTNPALVTGATAKAGESISLTDLRNASFWTTRGFTTGNWDFTPLSNGGWPVLK